MNGLAVEIDRLPRSTVEEGSLLVKKTITGIAPARLRNVGKKGANLNVRYTIGSYEDGAKSLIFAQGPWPIIESDTRPHAIPRLAGSRSRKDVGVGLGGSGRGRLAGPAFGGENTKKLALPNGGFRSTVFHPGTKGKHPWARGVEISIPLVADLFRTSVVRTIARF